MQAQRAGPSVGWRVKKGRNEKQEWRCLSGGGDGTWGSQTSLHKEIELAFPRGGVQLHGQGTHSSVGQEHWV